MAKLIASLAAFATLLVGLDGHVLISYPGWRGNNLITNQTFPFGMQWSYPCGGLNPTNNRTAWPINGGAVAFQPGWFQGHLTALMYINLCLGSEPVNCSLPLVPLFEIAGPSNNPYPGTVCLPQIPLPAGFKPKNGDFASIQVVQAAKHGAGMFSCADIIFTEDLSQVPEVTTQNCFNSTDIRTFEVEVVRKTGNNTSESQTTGHTVSTVPTLTPSQTPDGQRNSGFKDMTAFSASLGLIVLAWMTSWAI